MPGSFRKISLKEFLTRTNEASPNLLPLVHTTQGFNFIEILSEQRLKTSRCPVFNENLCYLFLGRPAYKVKSQPDPAYWELPIAFIVQFDEGATFERVFPFDSGAYRNGLLPSSLSGFPLERYDFAGDHDLIKKFVATFFESNDRYFKSLPRSRTDIAARYELGPAHMEIDALVSMYNMPKTNSRDDRSSIVEVQVSSEIAINSTSVLGVILPKEFQRDADIVAALSAMTCDVRYYDVYPIATHMYYGQIYDLAKQILERGT